MFLVSLALWVRGPHDGSGMVGVEVCLVFGVVILSLIAGLDAGFRKTGLFEEILLYHRFGPLRNCQ